MQRRLRGISICSFLVGLVGAVGAVGPAGVVGAVFTCAFSVALGCADLKTATPGEDTLADGAPSGSPDGSAPGSDGSSGPWGSDGSSPPLPPGKGPGPHGSLPSGYCCTADTDCRQRHCADTPGGKMCLDECHSLAACQREGLTGFICDNGGSSFEDGHCKPPSGFACIPQAEYERGTKLPGECCTPTGNGNAGLECEGSMCVALGDGPFVCTNACDLPKDCSGPFICQQITDNRKNCVPANSTYTCK